MVNMVNAWVLPILLMVGVGVMGFCTLPEIVFIIALMGAMVAACFAVGIWKMGQRKYPINVHIYVDKFNGISCDYSKGGYRTRDKKTNKYFIVLTSGDKIADPGREWEVSSSGGGRVLNLYTNDYVGFHPFKFTADKEVLEAVCIPSDYRQWLADQFRINKRVTEKFDKWAKIFPWISIIIVAIACGLMFLFTGMGISTMCG
jgi:hypothetical protein